MSNTAGGFSIPFKGVYDFPHGPASTGGWFCRACGDPVGKGDQIFKPAGVWVCETCFQAGNHTANTATRAKTAQQQQTAQQHQQAAQSQKQQAQQAWDQFSKSQGTAQNASKGAGYRHQDWDDDYRQGVPPPKQAATSDVEEVNEENWIEIIFECIPDRHVKRVYAALSRTYHPDVGGDTESQIRINSAYQKRQSESG